MGKTVCIIGAGVGGLMAGALLAKKGYSVTVLEKATTVGGSAGWYVRKGRIFPTGATIAFGLEERGLLDTLLEELHLNLQFDMMQHPMDVILEDRKVSIYQDEKRWDDELLHALFERKQDVKEFWEKLDQISELVYEVTATGVSMPIQRVYDLGKLPRYALTHPKSMLRLARYATWTVEDLLRKYNLQSYEPLRQFLDAQLMDAAQTDCTEAALLPSSLALTIYRKGSFYIEKGMGQLSEVLAQRIVELGGEVIVASPVKEIYYEQKNWHVTSKKRNEAYDVVINNTGISFGQGTSHAAPETFSWGAFRIDALVNDAFWHKELHARQLPFALQIVPSKEHEVLYSDGHGPVYVTFQTAYNQHNERVHGEIMMTLSIHTNIEDWDKYSKEEYKEKKQRLTEAMLAEIQKVVNIEDYLIYKEAGSPLTYKKFIGKSGVGGFPLTVRNAIVKPKSIRSSLPQLYIVGEQSFPGPGTLSSALSGYYAARAIMRSHPLT
ncbi:phytoene desaturase family protein [Lysinibacillus sp. 54212]|uniref:phytoene desaturase family protein n=1 Tax=Lysinibacillus sp. 54212 TaxID=3119829 RepID=UPI002FCC2C92